MSESDLNGLENEDGLIVPMEKEFMSFGEGGGERIMSNFPLSSPEEQWQLMSLATSPDCKGGSEVINSVIDLHYWMCHEVEVTDDDDNMIRAIRTVLIDKSGDAFAFVSGGIFRSLRMLVKCFGKGPYEQPLPVQVMQSDTKGGRRILHLRPAPKKGKK